MKKFGIINHPGFYKFLRRKMRHRTKIRNKERMGYRGPKQRYSVWRAEYNQKWKPLESDDDANACKGTNDDLNDPPQDQQD